MVKFYFLFVVKYVCLDSQRIMLSEHNLSY